MSECMSFPDTVEEFMDSYKIVDTEQVYTNGTEMVPIYRMRQWFQHEPEIVRCKDCKHSEFWYRDKRRCFLWHEEGIDVFEDGFCNYAERRTDDL